MSAVQRKKRTASRKKGGTKKAGDSTSLRQEIILWCLLAVCVLLLLSYFGIGGVIGGWVSYLIFGLVGMMAYPLPVLFFAGMAFLFINKGSGAAKIKTAAGVLFFLNLCAFLEMVTLGYDPSVKWYILYHRSAVGKTGGGLFGGLMTKLLCSAFGIIGTYVIIFIVMIICLVLITERSLFRGIKRGGTKVYTTVKEDSKRRRDRRMDRKVSGVALNTQLPKKQEIEDDIHEIKPESVGLPLEEIPIQMGEAVLEEREEFPAFEEPVEEVIEEEVIEEEAIKPVKAEKKKAVKEPDIKDIPHHSADRREGDFPLPEPYAGEYEFPDVALLKKGRPKKGKSNTYYQETALKLQQTLNSFGVKVQVTKISCGPSVTRYEIQPEQGVKVSRIVGLADDIKLNLAAADIRIEAPIPGKAAVGIEVPNNENEPVMLRELMESEEFKKHPSNIAFAVGKDIAGQIVVTDIARMPHLLIAGATGSGKSVCINTLIMSILYKANPDDVRLIMIDPKVVELSVYNNIPHLLIPVVTDPKKAAGALHWAVTEMTDRYKKFADANVRDLKGYNKKVEALPDIDDEDKPAKLPQIVIIVDELADLMMVAPGEVEDAICRLAQLARAAGLHLIIATQRPSVNVITGLIKANMPSRIAFSVSSGVDSRTIIDMNGAEKLLGKGDMLFYPSGYQKPVRMQGAFVSDSEVSKVTEFLTKQNKGTQYNQEIESTINEMKTESVSKETSENDRDEYFVQAARHIIEKDKASIGMLQRILKIGFNRAARIMDQLAEAGIVGEEEGTKPRKILMTREEFEAHVDEF